MFNAILSDINAFEKFVVSLIPQHALRFIENMTPSNDFRRRIEEFEAVKTVTLEEAVEPLASIVPEVRDMVAQAKAKCTSPKEGLTVDESAAIMLYSLEWKPRENSFYFILNSTLREENLDKLKPWELYLKLTVRALEKLPTIEKTLYRGVKRDLRSEYPQGKVFTWPAFSSTTRSVHVLQSEQFLGKTGTRTLFNIDCKSGKDIKEHSFFPTEDEVLLIAARRFEVTSVLDSGNDLHIIQLKEIDPDHPLLGSIKDGGGAAASSSHSATSATAHQDSSAARKQNQSGIPLISQVASKTTSVNPMGFFR